MQNVKRPKHFVALDGFRGLLALCVAIYHSYWYSHINSFAFFENGPVILDLFFVFSGFLMFYKYSDNLRNRSDAAKFLKRRFARLYPVHLVMLIICTVYAIARLFAHNAGLVQTGALEVLPFDQQSGETVWSILSNLLLIHSMGVHDGLGFNVPSWTISVEFFAYIVFASILLAGRLKKPGDFAGLFLVTVLFYAGLSRIKPDMDITYDFGFIRCLAGFFVGILTAKLFQVVERSGQNETVDGRVWSWLEWGVLSLFIGFVICVSGRGQFFIGPVAALFVLIFAMDRGFISRLLAAPVFQYLARISYSVYMVHFVIAVILGPVFRAVSPEIDLPTTSKTWIGDAYLLPYLLLVIGAAHLLYHAVEAPGRRFINAIPIRQWLRRRVFL